MFTGFSQLYQLGRSPINVDNVKKSFQRYPNPQLVSDLIQGLQYGFKLQYSGPRLPVEFKSRGLFGEMALIDREKINKEVTLRASPISIIPKKTSNEFRMIHNLSFPLNNSVNDYIDKEYCTVKYSSIDNAVTMIQNLGKNALLAKCDVQSAFRLLRLSPSDFDLTGFKFENKYYFDKCLPMGASISCLLFESFSTALHWFVQDQSKNNDILHYFDDFLFGGSEGTMDCRNTLLKFQECCRLAEEKTVEPTEVLVFLGIEFDTINMVMRIPQDKIDDLRNKLVVCLNSNKITLRNLQSLIGTLNFACHVIVPGRAFCRRLIDATCYLRKPHHKTHVTKDMKDDIRIWLSFIHNYNGTTVILDRFWSCNDHLQLFSDSAGVKEKGFGVYFNGKWAQASWLQSWIQTGIMTGITFLELFPIVVACRYGGFTWQIKEFYSELITRQ